MMEKWSIWGVAGVVAVATMAGQAVGMGASVPPPGPVVLPRAETAPAVPSAPQAGPGVVPREAGTVAPDSLLYASRPVVVFADSPADPAFAAQIALLERDPAALTARDVVVIVDTDPAAESVWRQRLRPRGFSLVVMDKQGMVIERKPVPWDTREIGRAIDKTPERRAETTGARGAR